MSLESLEVKKIISEIINELNAESNSIAMNQAFKALKNDSISNKYLNNSNSINNNDSGNSNANRNENGAISTIKSNEHDPNTHNNNDPINMRAATNNGDANDSTNRGKLVIAKTLKDIPVDNARAAFAKTPGFHVFLFFTFLLCVVEPFLVCFPRHWHHGAMFNAQVGVLAGSTLMFFIGLVSVAQYYPPVYNKEDVKVNELEKYISMFDGEVILECVCLIFGWVFLFTYPGIAALRCFRVFRLMWYFELYEEELPEDYNPVDHPFSLTFAAHQCLEYLEKLGTELVTADSRGALVVLGIFFYVTYILACVFWTDKSYLQTPDTGFENGYACTTLPMCFITMMRLAFYDGNGLDYLTAVAQEDQTVYSYGPVLVNASYFNSVSNKWMFGIVNVTEPLSHVHHKGGALGYAVLLVMYMVFAAVILLNGLIGIFGQAFVTDASDSDSEEELEDGSTYKKKDKIGTLQNENDMIIFYLIKT